MGKIIFQTQASCPIDRRPFQAVCQLGALEDQIKVRFRPTFSYVASALLV